MSTPPQLQLAYCRQRQQRLIEVMRREHLDWVVLQQHEHIQYLIGHRFTWLFQPLVGVRADGHVVLIAPEQRVPTEHAADEVITYSARWHSTIRNDQRNEVAQAFQRAIGPFASTLRWGIEQDAASLLTQTSGRLINIEPHLLALRRRKDPDELEMLRFALQATGRMYERARQMLQPGISELDLFSELQAEAVRFLGEPLTATGNDYQVASRGGPPRRREAQAGELYILDLGPAYRGYFADDARTLAVTDPTPIQTEAWRHVTDLFAWLESEVRPGVSARAIFNQAQERLDRAPIGTFNHHLGHGIGLFPHEGPHLNPHWDDTFQPGDVFTAEPGLYAPELRAGIRVENAYLVTESGVDLLTDFPLELRV